MKTHDLTSLTEVLPYARRFARALTGSQAEGDALVAEALRRGLPDLPPRLAFYAGIAALEADSAEVQAPHLSPLERRVLLLLNLEDLSMTDAGIVLGMGEGELQPLAASAHDKLKQATATDVLIIEDEPIIAMDIRLLVQRCGHRVVGVASSEAAAVALAAAHAPGLILADVNLGRGGDGITAVRRILSTARVPVIFVTAYPERLLSADGLGPAFVINKPFDRMALAIATYQAITAGRPPG